MKHKQLKRATSNPLAGAPVIPMPTVGFEKNTSLLPRSPKRKRRQLLRITKKYGQHQSAYPDWQKHFDHQTKKEEYHRQTSP